MTKYDYCEEYESARFLVILIGSLAERVAVALKRRLDFLIDDDKALRLISVNPASGFSAESDNHTTLCLDSERFQLNDECVPSAKGLVYLRDVIGQRFQDFDALFIVTDFRSEDCLPLALGLSYLLSTKSISSQSFVQAIVAETGGFELPQWRLACQKGRVLLGRHCDTVVVNSTKKVLNDLTEGGLPLSDYFEQEAVAVARVVELFAELTWRVGLIGIDFTDLVVVGMGEGILAYGYGEGENAAEIAVDKALNQLQYDLADWDDSDIGFVLANLSTNPDFPLAEFDLVGNRISSFFNASVCVRVGITFAPELAEDERRVKVLAVKNKTLGVYTNR